MTNIARGAKLKRAARRDLTATMVGPQSQAGTAIEYLDFGGYRIEVRWWRASDAHPPIVLLHEGLGSISRWRDFPDELVRATNRPVVAYSRAGHGASDPPPIPHTVWYMHEEARLLPNVLDRLGIREAILFGHSDGGSIALIAAAEHPERVQALILEAPHVFVEPISIASVEAALERYRTTDMRERLARHHRHVDVAFSGWSDVWLDPAFRDWNLEEFLPRIHCPVLLIQGGQDEYGTLEQIDTIARHVRAPVERVVLDDCRHAPHKDQREAVIAEVRRFLGVEG